MAEDKRVPVGPLGRHVISALERYRKARRLTYSGISRRLEALGRPIPPQGLRRIERGDRRVDVDDLVALAHVLQVPPLQLILPIGEEAETEVMPGRVVDTWAAAQWFTGDGPWPGSGEGPDSAVPELRDHDRVLLAFAMEFDRLPALREAVRNATTDEERAAREAHLELLQEKVDRLAREVVTWRRRLRKRGVVPPPLPPQFTHLDEGDQDAAEE